MTGGDASVLLDCYFHLANPFFWNRSRLIWVICVTNVSQMIWIEPRARMAGCTCCIGRRCFMLHMSRCSATPYLVQMRLRSMSECFCCKLALESRVLERPSWEGYRPQQHKGPMSMGLTWQVTGRQLNAIRVSPPNGVNGRFEVVNSGPSMTGPGPDADGRSLIDRPIPQAKNCLDQTKVAPGRADYASGNSTRVRTAATPGYPPLASAAVSTPRRRSLLHPRGDGGGPIDIGGGVAPAAVEHTRYHVEAIEIIHRPHGGHQAGPIFQRVTGWNSGIVPSVILDEFAAVGP